MEKVLGIGGFFFRAKDPKALAKWYSRHLGVDETPPDYDHAYWIQQTGPTVFEPFNEDTDYFGDAEYKWMLNFRVRNLPAMIAQLEAAGIEVDLDPTEWPNGRFARIRDPEGNPIAIWQPRGNEESLPPSPAQDKP